MLFCEQKIGKWLLSQLLVGNLKDCYVRKHISSFSEILKECFLFFFGTIKSSPSLNFLCYMGVTCINFYTYNNVYSFSSGLFNVWQYVFSTLL